MPEHPWIIYRMSEGPLTTKEVHQGVNEQLNRKLGTDWGYSEYEWANLLQGFRPLPIRTASGTIAHFTDGADDVPMKSVVANIVPIQSGTGTPSPSNPRPISGTSVLNVEKRGVNLFNKKPLSDWVIKSPYIVLDDNLPKNALLTMVFIDKDTSVDISGCYLGFVKDTYNGGTVQNTDFHWALQNGTVRGRTDNVAEIGTDLCNYLMMYPTNEATYNKIFSRFDVMIVAGAETATTFEAYTGSTYTIDLGQEIMGGTADVVGGVGSKTHELITLDGSEAWQAIASGADKCYTLTLSGYTPNNAEISDIFQYLPITTGNFGTFYFAQGIIRIPDGNDTFATLADFKQWLSENTPSFLLQRTTPTDFTFTGQPIRSLPGVNNVWADSGEVLDVEYRSNF